MDITGSTAIVTGGASRHRCRRRPPARRQGRDRRRRRPPGRQGRGARRGDRRASSPQVDVTDTEQIAAAVDAAAEIAPLRALVNSAGIGWAQRTIGRDGELESGARPRRLPQGHRDQPDRHLRHDPPGRDRDEPQRARRRRPARRDRQPRLRRRLRRPDRPGVVLRLQGRRRRHDPAGRARPLRVRHPAQHRRARPDRHPDLRRVPRPRRVQGQPRRERALPQAPRRPPTSWPAWSSSASPTPT